MASHHEESGRSDSRGDQVESKKSVDKAASSKATSKVKGDATKDDDWGYEPKKAGMAIEAKMGMCIVVILLSAFGFLVYRKFDARQRDLLQANLQAAEQSLPGSTEGKFVGEFAEFQKSDGFADTGFAAGTTQTQQSPALDVALQDLESAPTFGSTFALQDEFSPDVGVNQPSETQVAAVEGSGPLAGNPFDDSVFGNLAEPDGSAAASNTALKEASTALAFAADSSATQPAGQMGAPLDDYLQQRAAREAAKQQNSAVNHDTLDSSFAAFADPAQTVTQEPADAPAFADRSQNEESNFTPSFDSFPAGFEPEFDNGAEAGSEDAAWVKTDSTMSSGQLEALPAESVDHSVVATTDEQTGFSPLDASNSQQGPPGFDGFESFSVESQSSTIAVQPAGNSTAKNVSPESSLVLNSDFAATSQPPGFADFAATVDSSVTGTKNSIDRPQSFSGGLGEAVEPLPTSSGVTESFAAGSRPTLSPFTGGEDELAKAVKVDERRSPSIDPTSVVDPLDNVAKGKQFDGLNSTIQLAQADFPNGDEPWDINSGRLPIEDDGTSLISRTNPKQPLSGQVGSVGQTVDDELVNSFRNHVQPAQPKFDSLANQSLSASESLRQPRQPSFQQPIGFRNNTNVSNGTGFGSNGNKHSASISGKVQQVSATANPVGIYTVKPDDTYWTISKHAYGTARFFSSLALYNKNRIKDPRKLREGMKVIIPDTAVLIERYPELLQDYIPKKTLPSGYFLKPNGMPAYRIGANEMLSKISQKHLGRASRWIQIYRMNQDVLDNPNSLKLGTVIDLPDDATNVHMMP